MNPSTKHLLFSAMVVILLLSSCAPAPAATQDPSFLNQLIGETVTLTLTAESSQNNNDQLIEQSVVSTLTAINELAAQEQNTIEEQMTPTPNTPTMTPSEVLPEATLDPKAPTIKSISPSSGFTTGGSTVTITGSNFTVGQGLTQFYFGDIPADPNGTLCKSTIQCRVIVPFIENQGNVTVTARNEARDGNLGNNDTFTYIQNDPESPVIENIQPRQGTSGGGTKVTIEGKNFKKGVQEVDANVTRFYFGENQATDVVCETDITCTLISPPGEEGYVVVRAINNGHESQHIPGNDFDGFKYTGIPQYGCSALTVTPKNLTVFTGGESFAVKWIIANTGESAWPSGLDVKYFAGTKMSKINLVEIPIIMGPHATHMIKIDAVAPNNPGTYYMTWIVEGMGCTAYVAITVE